MASIAGAIPLGWLGRPLCGLAVVFLTLAISGCACMCGQKTEPAKGAGGDTVAHETDEPAAMAEPVVEPEPSPPPPPAPMPEPEPEPEPAPVVMLDPFVQDIADTTHSFEMVPIPGGPVIVPTDTGDAEVVVDSFWISPTELPWELFDVFFFRLDRRRSMEGSDADAVSRPSRPYLPPDRGYGHDGYPTISISFYSAQTYCEWLSLKTGKTFRLPTEAEWHRVCELGGLAASTQDDHAWHEGNSEGTSHPVGKKTPDANGIYDMWGNVAEWCTDMNGEPITLGGSFRDKPDALGCGARVPPTERWNDSDPQIPKGRWWLADCGWVGFRIVCVPTPEAENGQ